MPDTQTSPTHVLTTETVRWGIETLGAQRIHPAFIFYLYLRKQSIEGLLSSASASSAEVSNLLAMPGGPEGRPYYRPMRERGRREGLLRSFWLQDNLAGSWAPSSLARISPAKWLVGDDGKYVMPTDHAQRATKELLFDEPVPVYAAAAFFLRNDGFALIGEPADSDLETAFRYKFRFDEIHDNEYKMMFSAAQKPSVTNVFRAVETGADPESTQAPPGTGVASEPTPEGNTE